MKTMIKLCARFNRLFPDYDASLDEIESYRGWYRVYIVDPLGFTAIYDFKTCRGFREWMDSVII